MNNDLISRAALKEAMNIEALNLSNGGRIFIENINKIIDNAPTVDFVSPTINVNIPEETKQKLIEELQKTHKIVLLESDEYPFYQEAYQTGYEEGRKDFERPQGKWDEIREPFGWDDILSARCSVCGESYPYPEETGFNDIVEMFKYCPNCGAKMEAGDRWKEEEE